MLREIVRTSYVVECDGEVRKHFGTIRCGFCTEADSKEDAIRQAKECGMRETAGGRWLCTANGHEQNGEVGNLVLWALRAITLARKPSVLYVSTKAKNAITDYFDLAQRFRAEPSRQEAFADLNGVCLVEDASLQDFDVRVPKK